MSKTLFVPVLLLNALLITSTSSTRAENKIPDECKSGGFFIGCQAYTFNRFSLMEAIEKTAKAGGKVIELFPGQKFSSEEPKLKCDHNASEETLEKAKA